MKMYTCCPHAGCTAYRDGLTFLQGWGIEPDIGHDEDGHFFQFDVPDYWPKRKKRAFAKAIANRVSENPAGNSGPIGPRKETSMNDKRAEIVFQLCNVLATHSPDPHDTYEYLIHTICGNTDSLNAIVGTMCSLTDEFRRNHDAEPTAGS